MPPLTEFKSIAVTTAGSVDDEEPPSSRARPSRRRQAVVKPDVIDLTLMTRDCRPTLRGWLEPTLAHIATLAKARIDSLSLVLVDDARMAELHQQYSGVHGTTDVLTFDLRAQPPRSPREAARADPIEGEIIICRAEAARQARQQRHLLRLEILLYAVHGLLHLLGHDDHDPVAFRTMHRREDQLLQAAGFPPLYHRPMETHPS